MGRLECIFLADLSSSEPETRQRLGSMKRGKANIDSHQGTVEAFLMGGLSGLGLVMKRVSLAGKLEKGPQKCQTHGGN